MCHFLRTCPCLFLPVSSNDAMKNAFIITKVCYLVTYFLDFVSVLVLILEIFYSTSFPIIVSANLKGYDNTLNILSAKNKIFTPKIFRSEDFTEFFVIHLLWPISWQILRTWSLIWYTKIGQVSAFLFFFCLLTLPQLYKQLLKLKPSPQP